MTPHAHRRWTVPSLLLALVPATLVAQSPTAKRKPNIVYIMADELGYYEVSYMGHPNIQTPNIDKMAAGGVRFTQALAGSAVCAPNPLLPLDRQAQRPHIGT